MKLSQAFPSKYLSAKDLNGENLTLTIAGWEIAKLGDDKKPVLKFQEIEKRLVLNVTNGNLLEDLLQTDELDEWVGARITLGVEKVQFGNKRVPALRVQEGPQG